MKSLVAAFLLGGFAAVPAIAQDATPPAASAVAGKYLYDADGRNLGSIYKVTASGSAQIILDDRQITIPASTISLADGKLTTSLTKREIRNLR